MKKLSLLLLISAMLCGGAGSAWAESPNSAAKTTPSPITTQEQAIARTNELGIVPEGALITQAKRFAHVGKTAASTWDYWRVDFGVPKKDASDNGVNGGQIVLQSANGELTEYGFSLWPAFDPAAPQPPAFDESERKIESGAAVVIARSFIDKTWKLDSEWIVDPYPESEYSTRTDDKSLFKIRFDRAYNGIRLDQQQFVVYVDKRSGEVKAYQANWNKTAFTEPASKLLNASAAARLFVEKTNPFLTDQEGTLVYGMAGQYTMDAFTGELPERNQNGIPLPPTKQSGKPRVPAAYAKLQLLSQYDIELQYLVTDVSLNGWKAGLVYRLVLKPSSPRFYTGSGPFIDANTGHWENFIGETIAQPIPQPSDWLLEAVASPKKIGYPAGIVADGKFVALSASPSVRGGTVSASSRELLGAVKATFQWNAKTKQLTATKAGNKLVVTVGSTKAYVNGKAIKLPAAPTIMGGKTYIPVSAVTQAFGGDIAWNASSRLLVARTDAKAKAPTAAELAQWRWQTQLQWELAGRKLS